MKQRVFWWVAALIVIVLVSFSIADSNKYRGNEISIGVIIPLSGNVASLGEKLKRGIDLAVEDFSGKNVRFIFEDGGIEPKTALAAYHKIATANDVKIFIGPFGPDQIMALAPVLKKDAVLLGVTLCDDMFKPYPQIFCTYPSIPDQTESGIRAVRDSGVKKLGSIIQIGPTGDVVRSELQKQQANGDYSLVFEDRMNLGDRDFRTLVTKVRASGAEGVYMASLPNEGYILLKQLYDLRFNSPIFAVFDATDEGLAQLGPAAEGVYLPGHISPVFESDFTSQYKETYEQEPDLYSALGYSIAVTLIEGLKDNQFKLEGLKEKLIEKQNPTAIMGFKFREDRTVSVPVESLIFKNGKIQEME
ncbi:MAG: ABC transporter substrate-binding protein [Candidatus Paceibacterota bacterium]